MSTTLQTFGSRFVLASSLLASLAATNLYPAENDPNRLEEVVVTATKRGLVNAQDVPISLTALSSAELKALDATIFDQWSRSVPGLVYQDQGPGDKRYIIRGVQSTGAATVGVYLDNAVITGSNAEDDGGGKNVDIRLFDINRVEVLRGPQGTLYGTSSMSGTIRILSNQPTADSIYGNAGFEISNTRYGSFNSSVNGTVNIPIVDQKAAFRATGWFGTTTAAGDRWGTLPRFVGGSPDAPDAWRLAPDDRIARGTGTPPGGNIGADQSPRAP